MSENLGTTALAEAGRRAAGAAQTEDPLEHRIVQGVKVSFIISVATLPFGYLLSLVLVRVSPEAVGIYSVLGIYLGVVSSLLYFGGGTVTIRFMAELPGEKRLPFLLSYFALTAAVGGLVILGLLTIPGFATALIGQKASLSFFRFLLLCAPITLLYFQTLAALRGMMQVALAQALLRSVTLAACLFYTYTLIFHKAYFQRQYTPLIVGSYFALMTGVTFVGVQKIWQLLASSAGRLSWFLPTGFWRFALAVQIPSMLALMQLKIDEILSLRILGLSQLGVYFVLSQLAGTSELLSNFFLDGVFPAVFNLQAAGKPEKNAELYHRAARHVLLICAGIVFFLYAFSGPLLRFLGTRYAAHYPSLLLLLCFVCLDSLGPVNQTLIIGLKKMKEWTAVQSTRFAAFFFLFVLFVPKQGILGVVLARGLAWALAGAIGYWIALKRLPIRVRIPREYFLYVGLSLCLAATCYWRRGLSSDLLFDAALFLAASAAFLVGGGYHLGEFRSLGDVLRGVKGAVRSR